MKQFFLRLAIAAATLSFAAPLPQGLSAEQQSKLSRIAAIRPTKPQLDWQRYELTAFFHFGINTFTGREWGDGKENPQAFNPTRLDCRQWARAAKAAGIKLAILTAKHHDGFCLWPSKLTTHTVAASPWRNGQGDVCRDFVTACREAGLKVGLYLSPWDRHEPSYGTPAYNDFFVGQLNELFDNYGPIDEIWFDGACGEGPNGKRQEYDWNRYYATIRKRNPHCVIAVSGPDVRWVGNESGLARDSEWSVVPAKAIDNNAVRQGFEDYHFEHADVTQMAAQQAAKPVIDAQSKTLGSLSEVLAADHWVWYPAECDVSIRPGWFYHPEQDNQVKTLEQLISIYDRSVGRNAVLLLNIPPMPDGRLNKIDVDRLSAFGQTLRNTFGRNRLGRVKPGQTQVNLPRAISIDTLVAQENIAHGQLVEKFHFEAILEGKSDWETIAGATTIGHKRILRLPKPIHIKALRLVIDEARAEPHILKISAHLATTPKHPRPVSHKRK